MHGKIFTHVDGGRAEGLVCADPGARTPISMSKNFPKLSLLVVTSDLSTLLPNHVLYSYCQILVETTVLIRQLAATWVDKGSLQKENLGQIWNFSRSSFSKDLKSGSSDSGAHSKCPTKYTMGKS